MMPTIADKQTFLLRHAYRFDEDFPEDFRKIMSLARPFLGHDDSDFRVQLGEIVYLHRRRRNNPGYLGRLHLCVQRIDAVNGMLSEIIEDLATLDIRHIEFFQIALAEHQLEENEEIAHRKELERISSMTVALARIKLGLTWATAAERKTEGRSRPRLPFLIPTLALIELWEETSGCSAVNPVGTASARDGTEAIQPSTEFIRLAFRMIDPKITTPNVFTSIKNALVFRRDQLSE